MFAKRAEFSSLLGSRIRDLDSLAAALATMAIGSFTEIAIRLAMRLIARALAAGRLEITVAGLHQLPHRGPVLLVARHYHHLFDGVTLYLTIPRQIHILVTLDWTQNWLMRRLMEFATVVARWPVVLRRDALTKAGDESPRQKHSAFTLTDVARIQRKAMQDSIQLLCEGRALVVFPEGYPNLDPHYTPKKSPDEFLPFKTGFAAIIAASEKRLGAKIPIVPVGLRYRHQGRWQVALRLGVPVYAADFSCRELLVKSLEEQVTRLSGLRE